ncbi:MAG TPA: cobalamin-dependent protein [Spirochaetia bacterium]|nr:cobalamin-dependent protein [Spirochaetia bacterium]
MADFAARLTGLRKQRGLRQVDLADAMGVAQTTIANYERKARFPDEQMLGRLADFFGVGMDHLLGRSVPVRDGGPNIATATADAPVLPEAASRCLQLLRSNHAEAALGLVQSAMRDGLSLGRVYREILQPALVETGRLWERGMLAVGEEHLISAATQGIMSRIAATPPAARASSTRPRCLVLAAAGETHLIGAGMVADLLRQDGWDAFFPGGNLGIRHVREAAAQIAPRLIAISVTMPGCLHAAADLIMALSVHGRRRAFHIIVGGQAFQRYPGLWREMGADATAEDAERAAEAARRLVPWTSGGSGRRKG